MELFRWILIIAGVGILALLYFSGRPKRTDVQRNVREHAPGSQGSRGSNAQSYSADNDRYPQDNSYDDLAEPNQSYSNAEAGYNDGYDRAYDHRGHDVGVPDSDPLLNDPNGQFDDLAEMRPDDFVRPGSGDLPQENPESSSGTMRSTIAQKIESFSSRLSPRRSQRVADISAPDSPSEVAATEGDKSKIVTIHIVAPQDQVFNGATLYELFEQRGLHFGEMNIFHSMHQQKKMFSILKMVEPGYFDINDINSFYTPGITLILQLPGPVAADVAFEVLISEASEIAQHLGGVVLGSDRSTLSNQAVSHMREDILEYMHRQRYFSNAAS